MVSERIVTTMQRDDIISCLAVVANSSLLLEDDEIRRLTQILLRISLTCGDNDYIDIVLREKSPT